jgi:glycopeptide antibiotics resistance protein
LKYGESIRAGSSGKKSVEVLIMGVRLEMQFFYIIVLPIWLLYRIIWFLIFRSRAVPQTIRSEILINVFTGYIFVLIGFTLFPLEITWGERIHSMYRFSVNYVPLQSIISDINRLGSGDFSLAFQIKLLLMNIGGNILMFIPLGVMLPTIWVRFRKLHYCLILGVLLSSIIELLQLFENLIGIAFTRICDVDDLIMNTLGTILGFLIYKAISVLKSNKGVIKQKNN